MEKMKCNMALANKDISTTSIDNCCLKTKKCPTEICCLEQQKKTDLAFEKSDASSSSIESRTIAVM